MERCKYYQTYHIMEATEKWTHSTVENLCAKYCDDVECNCGGDESRCDYNPEVELAAKNRQAGWISVHDDVPADGQKVLTYKNGIYEILEYEKRRNGWLTNNHNWFWSMATVSYWMPLTPPKEN